MAQVFNNDLKNKIKNHFKKENLKKNFKPKIKIKDSSYLVEVSETIYVRIPFNPFAEIELYSFNKSLNKYLLISSEHLAILLSMKSKYKEMYKEVFIDTAEEMKEKYIKELNNNPNLRTDTFFIFFEEEQVRLERERIERERIERQKKAEEQVRLERERIEKQKAEEKAKIERQEKARKIQLKIEEVIIKRQQAEEKARLEKQKVEKQINLELDNITKKSDFNTNMIITSINNCFNKLSDLNYKKIFFNISFKNYLKSFNCIYSNIEIIENAFKNFNQHGPSRYIDRNNIEYFSEPYRAIKEFLYPEGHFFNTIKDVMIRNKKSDIEFTLYIPNQTKTELIAKEVAIKYIKNKPNSDNNVYGNAIFNDFKQQIDKVYKYYIAAHFTDAEFLQKLDLKNLDKINIQQIDNLLQNQSDQCNELLCMLNEGFEEEDKIEELGNIYLKDVLDQSLIEEESIADVLNQGFIEEKSIVDVLNQDLIEKKDNILEDLRLNEQRNFQDFNYYDDYLYALKLQQDEYYAMQLQQETGNLALQGYHNYNLVLTY
ncbi:MAG: cell envelope integrity protein TolA [Rickettsiales bacterium]